MKKKVLFIAKIALSLIILAFIFSKISFNNVLHNLLKMPIFTIVTIFSLSFFRHFLQYINWKRFLMLTCNYNCKQNSAFKSYLIGLSLRFTLPGGNGTFGKVFFIKGDKKSSLLSILYEKFTVSYFNFLVASICCIFIFNQHAYKYLGLGISALTIVLAYYFGNKKYKSAKTYFKQLPLTSFLQFSYVFFNILQYWLILKFLCEISFLKILYSVPVINIANLIPITVNGLGLRETIAINVFKPIGITPDKIISATLLLFFINDVIPAIIGLKYIVKKTKPYL